MLGDDVHGLDFAFRAAGDDAVADGGEGGAETFFRAEGFLGADAEDVGGAFEGFGEVVDEGADVKADDQAEEHGEDNQRN